MTPEGQREAIELISETLARSPQIRLGQYISFMGGIGELELGQRLGYIEDDDLLQILRRHLDALRELPQPRPELSDDFVPTQDNMEQEQVLVST